jgi:glycerophosphoryl diester phosphodiesterase
MGLRHQFEQSTQRLADLAFTLWPRRRPSMQALLDCKIVSHRGEHDNRLIKENTLAAFKRVHDAGVWGIEFDVRWTRDLHPVVIHDPNTQRLFGTDLEISQLSLQDLQQQVAEIPTLADVVGRFGGRLHLMVELKDDELSQQDIKASRLQEIFAPLRAGEDYHFIALDLKLFELVTFAGDGACVPVAELNINTISRQALTRQFAGISGQYLLLHNRLIQRHREQQQKVGTGFASSRYCFYRELNRGVDWVFTNNALKLRAIQQALMRDR